MRIRKPVVAGQFYGGTRSECRAEIEACLPAGDLTVPLPEPIAAAIVPHAGWVFSGDLAAAAFKAIRQVNKKVDTFVLFGAAHRYSGSGPAVDDSDGWQTPLGEIMIDRPLAAEIANAGAAAEPQAHDGEHSIEVQVPFIQYLFSAAQIVPVLVPVAGFDPAFGTRVGALINRQTDKEIVCIASTDLTHYGPRYGFAPQGVGEKALQWAKEVNDAEFIKLAMKMEPERLLQSALDKSNACGPAATAALVAAAKARGRTHHQQ